MKITRRQLRTLIKEELEVISERWIPMSSFPERGIPNYNSNTGDPNDGLVALNTKLNSLMTMVMVLNDNLTSRADVREIVDEILGETEGGPQMTRSGPDVDLSRSGPPEIE